MAVVIVVVHLTLSQSACKSACGDKNYENEGFSNYLKKVIISQYFGGYTMKIYKVDTEDKLVQYKEQNFKIDNLEERLEIWFENNPRLLSLSEDENALIIGRQVTTNLGSAIDLLSVDKSGDLIVVELKRDRTPRETIAQLLEYASFVEELSYKQLEEIFIAYTGEENLNLADYHRNYFQLKEDEAVSFNKNQKLFIVAQTITREIKQISTYLRKRELDIYCLEFKYFTNNSGERIISTEFVVGSDGSDTDSIKKVSSGALPRVDKHSFIDSLDNNGREFFEVILNFAKENSLPIHWGSKGFSLNVDLNGDHVNILYGYPPRSAFKQSIRTVCAEIVRKVEDGDTIARYYQEKLNNFGGFEQAGSELKFMINESIQNEKIEQLLEILLEVITMVKEHGPKE